MGTEGVDALRGAKSRRWAGVFGAVGLISLLTLISRVVGFIRWLSQSAWVGTGAFASAYSTANQIPTVLFEVVAGGALAGITIPLLAGPIARRQTERVNQMTSALICWSLVLLAPVGLIVFLAAPLIAQIMPSPVGADPNQQIALITMFLRVFSLQVPLYGLCVVLTGVCQAHERFLLPALAPLLSSLVVISTYALFGWMAPGIEQPTTLADHALSVLAWGTTGGVAALSLPLFIPVHRLGIRLRPTLQLGNQAGRQALRLGLAGIGALIAQQVSVITVMVVIRAYGAPGSLPIYQYSQAVYTLPYAVLAVPIATATFPRLSALLQAPAPSEAPTNSPAPNSVTPNSETQTKSVLESDSVPATGAPLEAELTAASVRKTGHYPERFAHECALSTKVVTLVGILGMTLLIAEAPLVTQVFEHINRVPGMMLCLVCLGPGIIGYGLIYHISRVLYALHGAKEAVIGASTGWIVVSVASWGFAHLLVHDQANRAQAIMVAIGLAQSLGMTVSGVLLLWFLHRLVGRQILQGIVAPALLSLALAVVAAGGGYWLAQEAVQFWSSIPAIFLWATVVAFWCLVVFLPVLGRELKRLKRRGSTVQTEAPAPA